MKDEYFQKQAIRAKQRAKLLISRPDFQEEVLAIRGRFKISSGGITDEEINEKWYRGFHQSNEDYYETVWLKRREEIIQLKKEKKFKEAEDLQKRLNNEVPLNAFRIVIKGLLKTYKLPLRWEESVRRYILFNDLDKMWLPVGISLSDENDKDTNLDRLSIEIEDDTTLEDIKKGWQEVKYHQKQLHSHTKEKFQPIKRMDRDVRAYELKCQGLKLRNIADILSKEFDSDYEWYDVSKFIERHRKKLGMN